ncbi:MAG: CPBP family intramembrane metalloprotease [Bacteroidetes bacterium]|nr:CPBP family intramembrane metalloprotease [Bacteroidota bacterium]
MNFKFKLWLALTITGFIGVASLLFSQIPIDNVPKQVVDSMSPETLRLLLLINPALLVMVFTTIGILLYDKVKLSVPIFEKMLGKSNYVSFSGKKILVQGILLGSVAGIFMGVITKLFHPYLPLELTANKEVELNVITKLLYGGVTEELLMHFGLMTLFAWILFKITKKLNATLYWIAIVLAALLFGLGHLPIVFQLIAEPTLMTYVYIIFANSIGGVIFGYAYYKRGLECAIIVHAFAHLVMISLDWFIG